MKPAAFGYLAPETTAEALSLLRQHGGDARILAGGQSLVPMLNFRLTRFGHLIDINRITALSFIRAEGGHLRVGATTRQRTIEVSPEVAKHAPLLAAATRAIAHLPVRTRGTIGGSLAHADPAAEYPAVLVALGGSVIARSVAAEREITAADLFQGMFTTALEPDELLVEVRIPVARPNQAFGFAEFARRPGDLAVVGIAAAVELADGIAQSARIAAFGVEGSPRRLADAEAALGGRRLDAESIAAAAGAASQIAAQSDIHATGDLRSHLAGVLTARALRQAMQSNGAGAA
jgi:carbon-monoxide dehydrogenase medium subunit